MTTKEVKSNASNLVVGMSPSISHSYEHQFLPNRGKYSRLRNHSNTPLRHRLPTPHSGGDIVPGIALPGSTVIQFPHFFAYHYSSYFKDVGRFILGCWLGGDEFAEGNFAVVQPYSVGPRNCIGKNLAYAEMRLILAKFLFVLDI